MPLNPWYPTSRRAVLGGLLAAGLPTRALADNRPTLSTTLFDGTAFTLEAHRGQVVLLNFWATWCGPCKLEMPELDAYYLKHREQGLTVLALSTDALEDLPKVREVAKPYSFPVAMQKSSQTSGLGRIWRMPVSAVIDREGRLVKQDWQVQPQLNAAALDEVIQPLLKVGQKP